MVPTVLVLDRDPQELPPEHRVSVEQGYPRNVEYIRASDSNIAQLLVTRWVVAIIHPDGSKSRVPSARIQLGVTDVSYEQLDGYRQVMGCENWDDFWQKYLSLAAVVVEQVAAGRREAFFYNPSTDSGIRLTNLAEYLGMKS